MKNFRLLCLAAIFCFSQPAWAIVGGPFDNGSFSGGLERGSVYQAVMNFRNGNGFCYFHPESNFVPEDPNSPFTFQPRGSLTNRSVFYYKGITYVGSAFGTSDLDARYIQAVFNANTEVGFASSTTTSNTGIFGGTSSTSSVSQTVTTSNRSNIVNGSFEAKITDNAPTLRFIGKGELAFITPTGTDAVSNLAYDAYSGLIQAIIQAIGGATTIIGPVFSDAQTAIDNLLTALPARLAGAGIDNTYKEADVVKIKVRGTRRY